MDVMWVDQTDASMAVCWAASMGETTAVMMDERSVELMGAWMEVMSVVGMVRM